MSLTRDRTGFVTIALVAVLMATVLCEASAEPLTTIRANGDSANRVDLVILGDGYTASELDKYASDVETFIEGLFSQEPFREYQRYFNVHRVDVISNESGADHPEQSPPASRDTALDARYNCGGIQRLICVDDSKVNTVLFGSVPPDMRDVVLIIVNDGESGGSGGAFAVASVHADVVELILHELGHSFGLLADEYGASPGNPCDVSVEPPQPNVTKESERERIKWTVWIEPSTPLPTPGSTVGEPGLYEGAKYCDTGLFRPTYDSKMRSLHQPFEQINSEQLVKRVHYWSSPIDAIDPPETAVTLRQEESQTFRVLTPEPLTHALDIVWNVDGQVTATGNDFTLNASTLTPGSHTVEVVVSDPTPLVRNDPARVLTETRRWDVRINVTVAVADLEIHVTDHPDPVRVGGTLTYTLRVINRGPFDATGVRVIDTLPNNVDFVSASPNCSRSGRTVTCSIGDLRKGQQPVTLTITVKPTARGTVRNTAIVTANQADRTPGNNRRITATAVLP